MLTALMGVICVFSHISANVFLLLFFLFSTVNDAKGKQKVLGSNKKLKFNPTELILYCKDFRIVRFRFDEAGPESAKKVHVRSYTYLSRDLKFKVMLIERQPVSVKNCIYTQGAF